MIDSEKMIRVIDLEETTTPVAEQAEQRATSEGHDEANSTNLHSTYIIALLFRDQSTAVHWSAGFGLGVIHKCHLLAALLRSPMFH